MEDDKLVLKYQMLSNYIKEDVLSDLSAVEPLGGAFAGQLYESHNAKLVFLTLQTGDSPKRFNHICNNSNMNWNLKNLNIKTSEYYFSLPNVIMVFARGDHVEGTTMDGSVYKYVGLQGLQSVSSSGGLYLNATILFDYIVSRKEMENNFGGNVMKCKKNKYGCSLCA